MHQVFRIGIFIFLSIFIDDTSEGASLSQDNFPPFWVEIPSQHLVSYINRGAFDFVLCITCLFCRVYREGIFPRKSSRLSKSGIEIWKFLTSYIRALLARPSLLFSRELPWGLHSDRVATGFSISAYIDAHQQHVRVTAAVCARGYSSHPYHIFLHIMPLFSEPHLPAKGRKIETKSSGNELFFPFQRYYRPALLTEKLKSPRVSR